MHPRSLSVAFPVAVAVTLALAVSPALAGSGPASLACTAAARPGQPALSLKGLVPATESALNLTLGEGQHQVVMLAESGDAIQVVESFSDRVFTLVVTRKAGGPELRLYARPASIRVKRDSHSVHARFQAVLLEAPRPAPAGAPAAVLRAVTMSCQYDYEV